MNRDDDAGEDIDDDGIDNNSMFKLND